MNYVCENVCKLVHNMYNAITTYINYVYYKKCPKLFHIEL